MRGPDLIFPTFTTVLLVVLVYPVEVQRVGTVRAGEQPQVARPKSDETFTVSRADLEREGPTLIDGLVKGCNLIPAFVDGTAVGFKIIRVKPGSIFQQVGFANGDVLTKINGVPLNANGLQALRTQLVRPSRIEVEATRKGVPRATRINVF